MTYPTIINDSNPSTPKLNTSIDVPSSPTLRGKSDESMRPIEEYRQVNIRLTQAEIDAVRNLTKVDAIAPAVVSIVRKAIDPCKAERPKRLP